MRKTLLACALILAAFLSTHAQSGTVLLDNFAVMRQNGDGDPLWSPYTGGSSMGPGQTGRIISGGIYQDTVPANQAPTFQFIPHPYNRPSGFAKANLVSGTWVPDPTRLTFWMRQTGTTIVPSRGGGKQAASVGTYSSGGASDPNNAGRHFYHYLYANWYPNVWMLVTINRLPQHEVGKPGWQTYPDNPTAPGWNYFDGLTRFYVEPEYPNLSQWGGRNYEFANYQFAKVTGEPDAQVAGVTTTWTGSGYELGWNAPKNQAITFTVYYADVSMKVNGLAAGTKSSTIVNGPNSDYTGVSWKVDATTQAAKYFAIQPNGAGPFTEIYYPANGPYGTTPPPPVVTPTTTTVTCPSSVVYTGQPLTPCTAVATAPGFSVPVTPVTYQNNVNVGQATARADYGGDATHGPSSGAQTFQITAVVPPPVTILTCTELRATVVSGQVQARCAP